MKNAKSEVSTVILSVQVFWDVMLCHWLFPMASKEDTGFDFELKSPRRVDPSVLLR
jgi:hypothetical protein